MITSLTELYTTEQSGIIGRNELMQKVFLTLLRHEKPNVLLTGDPGVGKTSIVHLLADLIAKEACPVWLKGYQVLEVNSNSLLAGPGYRGVTEDKFENLIKSALGKKVILFFDEFHTITHLGEMANGSTPGFGNTLKVHLTKKDFKVIGATTTEELKQVNDKALLRRFTQIEVDEPNDAALLQIAEFVFNKYSRGKIENTLSFEEIVSISKSLSGVNPDKLKNLIDISTAKAKLDNSSKLLREHLDFALSIVGKHKKEEEF